jgi:protein-S-isoprenylcysteine O-methyltransferase Ste14
MSNYHFEKWLYKTILGFLLTAGGIFFMYYSLTHFYRDNWLMYALICSFGVGIGVFLLSSAGVNKVKSDLIKKQKQRQQST